MTAARKPVEPWDTEKAAQLAAEALRYLGRYYPECVASEVLRPHEEAAHEAAMNAERRGTKTPSEPTAGLVGTRRSGYGGGRRE